MPSPPTSIFYDAMPGRLGKVYERLWNECALLNQKWAGYLQLFGHSEKNVVLLKDVAHSFARVMHDALWESILLHIARLIEKAEDSGAKRLTLYSLRPLLRDSTEHHHERRELEKLLKAAANSGKFVKGWRDRLYAHREEATALGYGLAMPLASRTAVKNCIAAIGEYLNAVQVRHQLGETPWAGAASAKGAENLLLVLEDGRRFDSLTYKWKCHIPFADDDFESHDGR